MTVSITLKNPYTRMQKINCQIEWGFIPYSHVICQKLTSQHIQFDVHSGINSNNLSVLVLANLERSNNCKVTDQKGYTNWDALLISAGTLVISSRGLVFCLIAQKGTTSHM